MQLCGKSPVRLGRGLCQPPPSHHASLQMLRAASGGCWLLSRVQDWSPARCNGEQQLWGVDQYRNGPLASCYGRGSREGRCHSTHVAGECVTASQAQGCLTPKGGSSYYIAASWTKVRGCSRCKEPGPRCVRPPAWAHSPLVSSWILLRTPRLLHLLGWSLSGTNLYKVGRQGPILPP